MDDRELLTLARALQDLIRPRLRESESAREAARLLGAWLLKEAEAAAGREQLGANVGERPPRDAETAASAPVTTREQAGTISEFKHDTSTSSRGIVPLKIGDTTMHITVTGSTEDLGRARRTGGVAPSDESARDESVPIELSLIARRCRVKARGCRLFIERRAAEHDEERERPILDTMKSLIAEAKAMRGCFIWVFMREYSQPSDASLRTIAACYDALADAATLVARLDALDASVHRGDLHHAMRLMAEADSALRVALMDCWLTMPDTDQLEGHLWLRHESAVRDMYIPRFMRMDDPADPARIEALRGEIASLNSAVDASARAVARIESGFKQMQYHVRRLVRQLDQPEEHDQRKVIESVESLLESGVPTTDRRFADMIPREVAERMPADATRAATVLHWIITRADAPSEPEIAPAAREWSAQVRQARTLLEGRQVVIIGGEPRNDAITRIKDAFGLSDVVWVRLVEHGPGEPMRAPIGRPETAVVFVLVKFVGHLHAEEASEYARAAGKRCVYVRAGYNPEQLADAILNQASERLQTTVNGAE